MSTTSTLTTPAIFPSPSPSDDGSPDSCVSLASSLRCYYSQQGTEIHHTLLIIPVALELIFSTSLIFTNRRSGRRHLLLVAEGLVYFALALIEVLSFQVPAARDHVSTFRAIDQAIGALSFTQLLFYMSFLYAWVRGECLPMIPSRVRRVVRLLLLAFIPAVIAMNTVASFVGISYIQGPKHVLVHFAKKNDRFVWTFFSSLTLALLTLFQAFSFCFAFYRLIRAFITQRSIERDSKDAAVLFKGIGWMNGGIKLGAIETVIGFVFNGVPIAYVRRVMRMLSRALLSIGVAKGIDATEDFRAIRDELESNSSNREVRHSRLRHLISNPRFSTFRQLSPTATSFHATSRATALTSHNIVRATSDDRPRSYAVNGFLTVEKLPAPRSSRYAQSPIIDNQGLEPPIARHSYAAGGFAVSPKPTTTQGLPGMNEFAQIKAKRLSEYSPKRVTVYYHHGTPTLHLRLSTVELPSPAVIAESIKSRPTSEVVEEYRQTLMRTPKSQTKERSRFSATTRGSIMDDGDLDGISVYPASTTHGHTVESENVYRHGPNPYGYISSPSHYSADLSPHTFGKSHTPTTSAAHGHSPTTPFSEQFQPPNPAYLDSPTRRFSGNSEASGFSAVQAEIIDTPRRKLSFTRHKSALARAVLYPVPGTKVAMTLAGSESEDTSSPATPPRRLHKPNPAASKSNNIAYPTLPSTQRPSPSPPPTRQAPIPTPTSASQAPAYQPVQQQQESFVRESIIDEDGNVITVMAIAPSIEEDYDPNDTPKRSTRALSGYSVRSGIPETLQAVRELARKFPGLPPGAVMADIGIRASTMERDDASSSEDGLSRNGGHRQPSAVESTDTEEIIRKRIPAEMKMKGRVASQAPSGPLPPLPNRQVQQLPPALPRRNPLRSQLPTQQRPPLPPAQFTAKPIDPFEDDDTTSYSGTANDLSPLSMSVKLRHPQSFISTMYPNGLTSPVTPLSYYSHAQTSPSIIDPGTALREWNTVGQRIPSARPMGDLPDITMIEGHKRSLSAQTATEYDRKQQRRQQPESVASSDFDVSDELPDQLRQLRESTNVTGAPLNRIKSIGKVPRRITPQVTRGRHVRGSMHLQPLVIPTSSSSGRDVPISAVGVGGAHTILGVDNAGMNVAIIQEQDDPDAVFSATTEATSSNGRGGTLRFSEVLSIEDGGYVPIRLQGSTSRKGSY